MMTYAMAAARPGGSDMIRRIEIDVPAAGAGEVVIAHEAIGINFIDIYIRTGAYPWPVDKDLILGSEGAGIITAVGEGVSHVAVGDRVGYTLPNGAYATHRAINADMVVKLPDAITSDVAAAIMLKGLTVAYLVQDSHVVQAGDTVLVSAAAGATGSMACQIAKLHGCRVVGVVGNDEKSQLLQQLNVDAVVNYRQEDDLAVALARACPEGVNVYFDNVGGHLLDAALTAMAEGGRIVGCGMISDYNNSANPTPLYNLWQVIERQLTIKGFLLYSYLEDIPAASAQLEDWAREGHIQAIENITEGLPGAGAAYSNMMGGHTMGKNLVRVGEPGGS